MQEWFKKYWLYVLIAVTGSGIIAWLIYKFMQLTKVKTAIKEVQAGVQSQEARNIRAFLAVIRYAEGTSGADGYRMLFGGSLFNSFADHPRKVISAGSYRSDGAGAYQILSSTYDEVRKALNVSGFTPEVQDQIAIYLIGVKRGALDDVKAGNFEDAILKCNKEWASLPGSPYGQPTKQMAELRQKFAAEGGILV